jgi:hypothetical protein
LHDRQKIELHGYEGRKGIGRAWSARRYLDEEGSGFAIDRAGQGSEISGEASQSARRELALGSPL